MAQLLVLHLDDDVKAKLQRRARRHGHSTEEEVCEILCNAVRDEGVARAPLGSRLAARFAGLGLEILAAGRRRRQLEDAFAKALEEDLEGRVLPFDQTAAQAAGRIVAERRRAGRTVEIRDVQIAGIVNVRKATLATRNTRHFEDCGLVLIDPWSV